MLTGFRLAHYLYLVRRKKPVPIDLYLNTNAGDEKQQFCIGSTFEEPGYDHVIIYVAPGYDSSIDIDVILKSNTDIKKLKLTITLLVVESQPTILIEENMGWYKVYCSLFSAKTSHAFRAGRCLAAAVKRVSISNEVRDKLEQRQRIADDCVPLIWTRDRNSIITIRMNYYHFNVVAVFAVDDETDDVHTISNSEALLQNFICNMSRVFNGDLLDQYLYEQWRNGNMPFTEYMVTIADISSTVPLKDLQLQIVYLAMKKFKLFLAQLQDECEKRLK